MISLTGVVFPISVKHSIETKPIIDLDFSEFLINSWITESNNCFKDQLSSVWKEQKETNINIVQKKIEWKNKKNANNRVNGLNNLNT